MAYTYKRTILAYTPAAYWRFNDASGSTTAADSAASGPFPHTLTAAGAGPTFAETGALAKDVDRAVAFSGAEYLTAATLAATSTSFTIEFWIKPDSSQAAADGMIFGQDGGSGLYYDQNTGKISLYYSAAHHMNNTALAVGVWSHVAVVVAAGSGTFYVNGAADGTFTGAGSFTPGRVGGDSTGANLKGGLDELAYYPNQVMEAAMVLAHYTAGAAGFDPSHEVHMELQNPASPGRGNGWTDVTADLAQEVETLDYGIKGIGPNDRLADTGTFKFSLDNSESNSGGVVGYYSPGHAACRVGFFLGIRVRVLFNVMGRTFYRHVGTLDSIDPVAGMFDDRVTHCGTVDWMDNAARAKVSGLAVQFNKTSSELFAILVESADTQPDSLVIATAGSDTYPIALDTAEDEKVALLTEMKKLLDSELGYAAIVGNETGGGELRFLGRRGRGLTVTNADVFSDTDFTGLTTLQQRGDVTNAVQLVAHPRVPDANPTSILYDLQTPVALGAGATARILGPYRDPNQQSPRVGGTDMQAPDPNSPNFDYQMWSNNDGTGTDLTAFLTVVASYGGNGVRYALTNTGTVPGYVTRLRARGKGIYSYQTVIVEAQDDDSVDQVGKNQVTLDMPYQSTTDVLFEAATWLVAVYKNPGPRPSVTFEVPNADGALLLRLMLLDVNSRVGIEETVSGLAVGAGLFGYFINSVKIQVTPTNNWVVTWGLAPADRTAYWLLGVTGRGELGANTLLAMSL